MADLAAGMIRALDEDTNRVQCSQQSLGTESAAEPEQVLGVDTDRAFGIGAELDQGLELDLGSKEVPDLEN